MALHSTPYTSIQALSGNRPPSQVPWDSTPTGFLACFFWTQGLFKGPYMAT